MRSAARGAWIAGLLVWSLCPPGAHGQPAPDESTPATPQTSPVAPRSAVFLLPETDPETQARLRDALLAQFALVDARLVLEPAPAIGQGSQGSADRMGVMRERAAAYGALAAFSIDEHSDGRWFMYLLDVERERLLVRPLDASAERRGAAIEAVALMTREATRALLEGAPIPEPPPEAEPPPEPAAVRPAAPPSAPQPPPEHKSGLPPIHREHHAGLRLWLGYAGSDFAKNVALRHAGTVGGGWFGLAPWYAALSVELAPPLEVDDPVAFQVFRVPIRAHLGHRYQQGSVVFDLELAVTAELLRRSADQNQPAGVEIDSTSATDWLVGVGPRARVELLVWKWAGVAAELGFDALTNVNEFSYLAETPDGDQKLLQPLPVRPIWVLAMAFYP
jgi:hypothetical protein